MSLICLSAAFGIGHKNGWVTAEWKLGSKDSDQDRVEEEEDSDSSDFIQKRMFSWPVMVFIPPYSASANLRVQQLNLLKQRHQTVSNSPTTLNTPASADPSLHSRAPIVTPSPVLPFDRGGWLFSE